jgi:hypothetical protein
MSFIVRGQNHFRNKGFRLATDQIIRMSTPVLNTNHIVSFDPKFVAYGITMSGCETLGNLWPESLHTEVARYALTVFSLLISDVFLFHLLDRSESQRRKPLARTIIVLKLVANQHRIPS